MTHLPNSLATTELPASRRIVVSQDLVDVRWVARDVRTPRAKSTMRIDCFYPFGKEFALRLLLLVVLSLHFEYEHFPVCEADQVIRTELVDDAPERIRDLEPQMIVLDPSGNVRASIKFKSLACLPTAVEHSHVDVAVVYVLASLSRVPGKHVAGSADWSFRVEEPKSLPGFTLGTGWT